MKKPLLSEYELKCVVLGRVDELNQLILLDKTENYLHVNARLSEVLTIAMQLNLIEPIEATKVRAKADDHICKVYGVVHIQCIEDAGKRIKLLVKGKR